MQRDTQSRQPKVAESSEINPLRSDLQMMLMQYTIIRTGGEHVCVRMCKRGKEKGPPQPHPGGCEIKQPADTPKKAKVQQQ